MECERERSGKGEMLIRENTRDSGNKILEITYYRVKHMWNWRHANVALRMKQEQAI